MKWQSYVIATLYWFTQCLSNGASRPATFSIHIHALCHLAIRVSQVVASETSQVGHDRT
jgi:hypothetical protein